MSTNHSPKRYSNLVLKDTPDGRPTGAFEDILGGNVAYLVSEMRRQPELYEAAWKTSAEQVYLDGKGYLSLSDEQKKHLDLATLTMATNPRRPPKPKGKTATTAVEKAEEDFEPEEDLPDFWWAAKE